MESSDLSAMPGGLLLPISMLGLDFFLLWTSTGIFCYLLDFSSVYVDGGQSLAVVDGRVVCHDGVLCGGFDSDDVFFVNLLCVGVPIHCEFHNANRVDNVCSIADLVTNDKIARG